jgi:hypothetical protein
MSRKPRRKSVDPQVHAQQVATRKRIVEELQARGIEVRHDEQYRIIGAFRLDVFSLLHERKALTDPQLIAVRRLEVLIGTASGHERPEQGMDRVDSSTSGAPGQNISQAMIDASGELRIIMREIGFTNARLLMALLAPENSPAVMTRWRQTVADITREERSEVQAAMIRTACENLALAWQAFDYRARERRERAA